MSILIAIFLCAILLVINIWAVHEARTQKKNNDNDNHYRDFKDNQQEAPCITLLKLVKTEINSGIKLFELFEDDLSILGWDEADIVEARKTEKRMKEILHSWPAYMDFADQPITYDTYIELSCHVEQYLIDLIKFFDDLLAQKYNS